MQSFSLCGSLFKPEVTFYHMMHEEKKSSSLPILYISWEDWRVTVSPRSSSSHPATLPCLPGKGGAIPIVTK